MSLRALFGVASLRLLRDNWGRTFQNAVGYNKEKEQLQFEDVDTDVQRLADEVYAILNTAKIELSEPLTFDRAPGYTGPMMVFNDESGPTMQIAGDNLVTNINIDGIDSSVNIANDNSFENGDFFSITNFTGDINNINEEGDTTVINQGDTVIINNPGGGGDGQQEQDQHIAGKIVGGSGTTYTVDLYKGGPFQAKTETLEATCLGATATWAFPHDDIDVWVNVRKTGDNYWFNPPSLSLVRRVELFSVGDLRLLTIDQDGHNIAVAKPELLRTPDGGHDRNGISYVYDTPQSRGALQGATYENQVIVPEYVDDDDAPDSIYAAWVIDGTGVSEDGNPIHWIDLNVDGRFWAAITPEDDS